MWSSNCDSFTDHQPKMKAYFHPDVVFLDVIAKGAQQKKITQLTVGS